ncbi:Glutathione-dependent formaldehyde-activating enzyme/centromere protein V [Penicillium malachiteum]|uniref:Glutathione-dependent formaldehyde-activating enzyme/centromere protein V n=1 Tax=Penicillium malachiteum TaxID=1324776 RepID=UPI002548ECC2|nr:Glutathione-dependent formaldehyde-activating enzyme/centromere protein V [Penicillium malachiteum]KAJ5725224.1 Glutathione-dependent formaldehyde-activating enzyme/centromere protein V [Penicillium malachiteum]
MPHEPLHGSCSCGRIHYQIQIPDNVTDHASVYFDSSRDSRIDTDPNPLASSYSVLIVIIPGRFQGTPLTAWLRVPLDWYHSYTTSFFPDETHTSIRRTFTPHDAPQTQRIFCGFCGTPLSFWTEEPEEEADYLAISIGSLLGADQHALEDLHLLPEDSDEDVPYTGISSSSLAPTQEATSTSSITVPSFPDSPDLSRSVRSGIIHGIPWFEEMVEGSRLGRLMRSKRGKGVSEDKSTSFEWEISEWYDDGSRGIIQEDSDSNDRPTGKRKRGHHVDAGSHQKRA